MCHPNRILRTLMALSLIAGLALVPVSQAAEPKPTTARAAAKPHPALNLKAKAGAKRAADRLPTELASFTFQKVDAHFNPKEITIDPRY